MLEVDGRLLLLDGGVGSPGSGSALAESAELTERLYSSRMVPRDVGDAVPSRGQGEAAPSEQTRPRSDGVARGQDPTHAC